MADEITIAASLSVTKGNLDQVRRMPTLSVDMTGTNYSGGAQSIGTSYEAVTISADVATAGFAVFRNNDETNYVEIGLEVASTFYPFARLNAGEYMLVRLGTTSIFAQANTAAVDLDVTVLEA